MQTFKFTYNVPVDNTTGGNPGIFLMIEATDMEYTFPDGEPQVYTEVIGYSLQSFKEIIKADKMDIFIAARVKDWGAVSDQTRSIAAEHLKTMINYSAVAIAEQHYAA